MTKRIVIDDPEDGDFVMRLVGGLYNEKTDHVIAMHKDDRVVGGVVFTGYLQASILAHMAGVGDWSSRDLIWMVFDYAFNFLGVRKVVGLVASKNSAALSADLRLGFQVEARLTDMTADGDDMLIMTMTRDQCRWLNMKPRFTWKPQFHDGSKADG